MSAGHKFRIGPSRLKQEGDSEGERGSLQQDKIEKSGTHDSFTPPDHVLVS